MAICAHTLVKNEEKWLWYSVISAIDYVDKVLLWDTGSTDESVQIEKELLKKYPDKIILKSRPQKTAEEFTDVRQEMLEATKADWILMLDADEIWYRDSIKKVVDLIKNKGNSLESIVVPTINLVGDIFHKQEEIAGRYKLAGRVGHLNLRALNVKIPGLHSQGKHGVWGWADNDNKMIQEREEDKIKFVDAPYIHTTFLQRGGKGNDGVVVKRKKKLKYEIGESFPLDFYYPECLFEDKPVFVENPWKKMTNAFKFRALFETPLRMLKRRIWWGRAGY